MIHRADIALFTRQLLCVEYMDPRAVIAPITYARRLLIEARAWV